MPRYLHGFNDLGGESLHGNHPGWVLDIVSIGVNPGATGKDYRHLSNRGFGVLVRVNHATGSGGTIPLPEHYQAFAQGVANFAATCQGVEWIMIGNEPNLAGERPNGTYITPEQYARCFALCYQAIKQRVPAMRVLPAAMAPYNVDSGNWLDYFVDAYARIWAAGCRDIGIDIHAYTRGMNPDHITSTATMQGAPLTGQYSGFYTFLDVLQAVHNRLPVGMRYLPAFITEFDAYEAWEDKNTGVIQAAYAEIQHHNDHALNEGYNLIYAMLCFRWLGKPEVHNDKDWEMRNKPHLVEDFIEAAERGYQVPSGAPPQPQPEPDAGHQVFIPGVSTGGDPVPPNPPFMRDVDPRLYNRGVTITEVASTDPNAWIFKVVYARYFDESQSQGRHNTYVECVDEHDQPLSGLQFNLDGQGSDSPITTNGKSGFDAGNGPMWASEGINGYSLYGVGIATDLVHGIGMGEIYPDGHNNGVHTSQLYRFKRMKGQSQPSQPPPPSQPSQPVGVPLLVHPVSDPRYRTPSQLFGARPEVYSKFKIDRVPLKGHEGVDFPTPSGTQIVAVDAGIVTEVGDQGDKGYGKWIKVVHAWGETVYAHLEAPWVSLGDQAQRGQVIGVSGYTGNVEPKGPAGAHLHLGLRVKPFNRQDGWGGYRDPMPYLKATGTEPIPAPGQLLSKREITDLAIQIAKSYSIDWTLLLSLIHGESSYNPLAHNPESGAKGLGQIAPLTWGEWAPKVGATDIYKPADNLKVTAAYLKWCLGLVGGNARKALWCYNWSPRDVPQGLTPPAATLEFASKVLHGAEVARLTADFLAGIS